MKTLWFFALLMLLTDDRPAHGQAWTPPNCSGPNVALQYNNGSWICATLSVTPLPAQPPPTQCITSNWDGTKWTCVPTEYLTTGVEVVPPGRRQ